MWTHIMADGAEAITKASREYSQKRQPMLPIKRLMCWPHAQRNWEKKMEALVFVGLITGYRPKSKNQHQSTHLLHAIGK